MIKKLRIYQISLIAVSMLCIGLLAFMGITAIQKALTLNLKFEATPTVYFRLAVGEKVLLDNSTSELGLGATLEGNKITFSENALDNKLGATSFDLTITNYVAQNEADLYVGISGAYVEDDQDTNYETIISTSSASQTLSIATIGEMSITLQKVVAVNLSLSGITLGETNLKYVGSTYYLPVGEDLEAVIDYDEENYKNPTYNHNNSGAVGIEDNKIKISYEDLFNSNGEANLTLQAESKGYTIVFHKNDGSGTDTTISHVVGANQSYTMPSDLFENGSHEFIEWNLLANGSSQTKYQGGATVQGLAQAGTTIDLYAQWTWTVTFEITYKVGYGGNGAIFDQYGCGLAIMMTNDDAFKYYGATYYDSYAAGYNRSALYYQRDGSTPTILNPNRASSTPIKNKFLSTGFGYREYYSEYTQDNVSRKITYEAQCPSGYNIFIGNYGEENASFNCWGCTSCTITPNCTFSMYNNYDNLVSTFSAANDVQYIKTTMPNENLKIEVTTSYIYYSGSN